MRVPWNEFAVQGRADEDVEIHHLGRGTTLLYHSVPNWNAVKEVVVVALLPCWFVSPKLGHGHYRYAEVVENPVKPFDALVESCRSNDYVPSNGL